MYGLYKHVHAFLDCGDNEGGTVRNEPPRGKTNNVVSEQV